MATRSRITTLMQKNAKPRSKRGFSSVMESLGAHEDLANLLPSVTRLAAIQKDCAAALPELFKYCSALRFEAGQLVLTAPNAAVASRLKQKLPMLSEYLNRVGWQVISIRSKVQPESRPLWQNRPPKAALPTQALSAFAELEKTLEASPKNEGLKSAIHALLQMHGNDAM